VAKLIREHSTQIKEEDATYIARIYGEQRTDGTWEGWIEFHPTNKSKPVLRTAQETSQPNYVAIRVLGVDIYRLSALASPRRSVFPEAGILEIRYVLYRT